MNCCQMLRITQTIKSYWVYAFFLFAVSVFVYRFFMDQKNDTRYEVFKEQAGWGYRIIQKDTVFIQQQQIPAIQGYKYFQTKEDATNTAKLIVRKLIHHKLPMVTIAELDSLGVAY